MPTTQEEKQARNDWFDGLSARQQKAWQKQKDIECLNDPAHNFALRLRAQKRMERVDALPADVRQVVYDHGLEIVWELWTYRMTRAVVMRELIATVQGADDPYSTAVRGKFIQRGANSDKAARFLIDVILGADYPDGSPRFKFNKGPNAKRNPLNYEDDDECYYIVGSPAIRSVPA